MARADLLLDLAKAGMRGDKHLFRKTLEAMIAEERAKHIIFLLIVWQLISNKTEGEFLMLFRRPQCEMEVQLTSLWRWLPGVFWRT